MKRAPRTVIPALIVIFTLTGCVGTEPGAHAPSEEAVTLAPRIFPPQFREFQRTRCTELIDAWGETPEHNGSNVVAVSFAPDGKTAVSADWVLFRSWRVPSFKPLPVEWQHKGGIVTLARFLPDGKTLAVIDDAGVLTVYDGTSGKLLRQVGEPLPLTDRRPLFFVGGGPGPAAISRDGKLAVASDGDDDLRLFDVTNARLIRTLEGPRGVPPVSAVFSPDARRLYTGHIDRTVIAWDVETGKRLRTFAGGHADEVISLGVSADGSQLVSGGTAGRVKLWDVDTGKRVGKFEEFEDLRPDDNVRLGDAGAVAFSKSGDVLFVARAYDRSGLVEWWDVKTKKIVRNVFLYGAPRSMTLSPDGRRLLIGCSDGRIVCLDAATGKCVYGALPGKAEFHLGYVSALAISPDGTMALSGGGDGLVKFWDVDRGRVAKPGTKQPKCNDDFTIQHVAFAPDGKRAAWTAFHDSFSLAGVVTEGLTAWDVSKDEACPLQTPEDIDARGLAFSSDGKLAAAGFNKGNMQCPVFVWKVSNGDVVARLDGHAREACHVAFTPDGKRLVSIDYESTMKVWDIEERKEIRSWPAHEDDLAPSFALTPDGTVALSGHSFGVLRAWDVRTGRMVHEMKLRSHVREIAITPDGRFALCAVVGEIVLLDLSTWEVVDTVPVYASSLAVSPTGGWFLAGRGNIILRFLLNPPVEQSVE